MTNLTADRYIDESNSKSPDPLADHEKKLNDLVSGAHLQAIDQWQKFRAETDGVMQTLHEREQQILELISKLIADARASGAAVAIFSENLQRLQDEFRVQLPKAPNLKPNGNDNA